MHVKKECIINVLNKLYWKGMGGVADINNFGKEYFEFSW